ncbi:MAG: hypothetical protein ABJF01_18820 [bacterium]
MRSTERPTRRVTGRPTRTDTAVDAHFPRAVPGEEYERFARAMWRQGERWFRRHANEIAGPEVAAGDARTTLASAAATDLGRPLYHQEENLLSELLQRLWHDPNKPAEHGVPEIPSFLLD